MEATHVFYQNDTSQILVSPSPTNDQYTDCSIYKSCFCTPLKTSIYDTVIKNGLIVDGTGNSPYKADLGIKGELIVSIGDLLDSIATNYIDATGWIVSPGFIDIHSHADDHRRGKKGIRSDDVRRRKADNITTQGVTTIVVNPDGFGEVGLSIKQQADAIRKIGVAPNVALLIAHNAIRMEVMGADYKRFADTADITAMQTLILKGMQEGAFGMSSGLEYIPGRWSNRAELIALMKTVAGYDGIHISHIRSETTAPMWWVPSQHDAHPPELIDAVSEIIAIAEDTYTRGVITHMKVRGTSHWGQSGEVIKLMNNARARGVNIYADQYPYNSSGSDGRIVFIPGWALGVNHFDFMDKPDMDYSVVLQKVLADPEKRKALYEDIHHALAFRGGAENIVIYDHPDKSLIGKTLEDIAKNRKQTVIRLIIDFQMEGYTNVPGGARLRSFSLQDSDMINVMQQDWLATASDGGIALPADGPAVHARYYGTFPRKIGYYARDRGVISLEHAVRSSTGLPAEILKLKTRGILRAGMVADITVFDYTTIADTATFSDPHQVSSGVKHVFVGGTPVVYQGAPTDKLAGKVLTFGVD